MHEPSEPGWGSLSANCQAGDSYSCFQAVERKGHPAVSLGRVRHVHISGLGCVFEGGYSGHRISADQMKNMNLSRHILKKPKDVSEEEDAPDYEKCSDFFLTNQSSYTWDHFQPGNSPRNRYGIRSFLPRNCLAVDDREGNFGVPVHDACWKIFERVSKLRLGRVDLQGFMALWHRSACGECGFQNLGHQPILTECKRKWWSHIPGTEYLASNPYSIPGFSIMMLRGYEYTHERKGECDNRVSRKPLQLYPNTTDPFRKLPIELKDMILLELKTKDIASLRLVSRAFRQLSQRLYRHLIVKELPWFWEIDDIRQKKSRESRRTFLTDYGEGLFKLELVEADENYRQYVRDCVALKPQSVNWKTVYDRLQLLQKVNLGVRNRVRVWALAERIAERIGELRGKQSAEGENDLGGEEDLLQVQPTQEEIDSGLVNHGDACTSCQR